MIPPSVLPRVATRITGQKSPLLALTTAKTAGSDPIGSQVADSRLMTNTEDSPTLGNARMVDSQSTADSIIEWKRKAVP